MSTCLLGGWGERMDNIRYKMLELLVYKHVIVHLSMSIRMQQAFFFSIGHTKKYRRPCHIQLKTFLNNNKPPSKIWTLKESASHCRASSKSLVSLGFSDMNVSVFLGSWLSCSAEFFFLHVAVMSRKKYNRQSKKLAFNSRYLSISEKGYPKLQL